MPQIEAFTNPHVSGTTAHFRVSGIPETWEVWPDRIRERDIVWV
jgi:hypothetical protein